VASASPGGQRAGGAGGASRASPQVLASMTQVHEQKVQALGKGVALLEKDPTIADLKPCAGGISGDCIAVRAPGSPPQNRRGSSSVLSVANLPSIERKVALLIGVSDYEGTIPKLASPVKDVQEIGKIYQDQLGYEVRTLPNADKATIVRELNRLILESGPNDSITVMYAGHGHIVEKTQRGYWIPAKASPDDPKQWISNQDIAKALENIPAKQILLVSDSCYSGSLTREAKIEKAEVLPDSQQILARRTVAVLSSGGEEPVPDQGKDGHSVFAWHFMQQLKGVKDVSNGVNVFEQLSGEVAADIPQVPQYGAAVSSGHQRGGDYLFEVRKYQ
jgi:hypothetical protein